MRVRPIAALTAATVAATVALTAAPAQAALLTWTASCTAGGFTGSIRPHYAKGPGVTEYVAGVDYKISSHAGDEANILWHDGGTAPPTDFSTGDGVQDGGWHVLPGSLGDYQRGNGYTSVSFIFDKLGSDPRCATGKDW